MLSEFDLIKQYFTRAGRGDASGRTVLGEQGEPLRAVGISQDVTDRKRAEATLAQSEMRKAAILDSVLDCIVTMDRCGNVI